MNQLSGADDRVLGLRYVVDVVNDVATPADWLVVTERHGDDSFGARRFVASGFARVVSDLREVFAETSMERASGALNRMLADPPTATCLAQLPDGRWVLRPTIAPSADAAEALRAFAGFALGRWATDRGRCAWGVCAATGCDRVFIDEGRRSPQRFCSDTCATRTRVSAHRRRASGQVSGED
jgi:predicted RNA-binding Zn ribbon-like protein